MRCILPKILLGSSNHKNEKGGACGTHGGQETGMQGFDGETWGKKDTTWKTYVYMGK
jgi:hypothetical protein